MNAMPLQCPSTAYSDGKKAFNSHPCTCAAVRKKWDAEIDEFLKSFDREVDIQDTAWLTENVECATNKDGANLQCPHAGVRQDIWEQGGCPLQYNSGLGTALDLHQYLASQSPEVHDPLQAGAVDNQWHSYAAQWPPSPNIMMHLSPGASPSASHGHGDTMPEAALPLSDQNLAPCVPAYSAACTNLPGMALPHTNMQLETRPQRSVSLSRSHPGRDLVRLGGGAPLAGHLQSTAVPGQASMAADCHMQLWPGSASGHMHGPSRSHPMCEERSLQPTSVASSRSQRHMPAHSLAGADQEQCKAPDTVDRPTLGTALNIACHAVCSPAPHASLATMAKADSPALRDGLVPCPSSKVAPHVGAVVHGRTGISRSQAPVEPLWVAASSADHNQPSRHPFVTPRDCHFDRQQVQQQPPPTSTGMPFPRPRQQHFDPQMHEGVDDEGHREGCKPVVGCNGHHLTREVQQQHQHKHKANEPDSQEKLPVAPIVVHVRHSSSDPSSRMSPWIKGVSETRSRAVTDFTKLQTIVKLEKEDSDDLNANGHGGPPNATFAIQSNAASGSGPTSADLSPVHTQRGLTAEVSPVQRVPRSLTKLTVPAVKSEEASASGGRGLGSSRHGQEQGASAVAAPGKRRAAAAATVQPTGNRAAKGRASQKVHSSLSSEPEVSSDDDSSESSGSPCWQRAEKPRAVQGRRKAAAASRRTAVAKAEAPAVKSAPRTVRQKKPELPVADATGKEDAKKYRGVTRKINGRFEAQLHDHTARQSGSGKGDQVYLGVYVSAMKAAMAYDRAALRLFGKHAVLNFEESLYMGAEEAGLREVMTKRQYVAHIKSRSDADRGKSGFHGVAKRKSDRWQSRITGVACFGTFSSAEEAARAYDLASIHLDGEDAVLNYPLSEYWDFKTKALKAGLSWNVPKSVLNAPPNTARRKRSRGKGKKTPAVKDEVEEEVLVKTSRNKKVRRKGDCVQDVDGVKKNSV